MRGSKKNNTSAMRTLTDFIMLLVSIVVCVALVVSYFAVSVNPNMNILPSLLGLIYPALYLSGVALFLFWVIRWRIYSLIMLLILAIGYSNIELYFIMDPKKDYGQDKKPSRTDIRVMSYNVCGFVNQGNQVDEVLDFVNSSSPDIFCIQEFQTTHVITKHLVDSLLVDYPYNKFGYGRKYSAKTGWGLAIYTKYPIIDSSYIDFKKSNNSAMWVDLKVRKDTIRVFNLHLQGTMIDKKDLLFIRDDMMIDSTANSSKEKMGNILSKLSINNKLRANQVDSLKVMIDSSPYPVLLCGDFNDTPMSYSYGVLSENLNDAFVKKGDKFSNTFGRFLRIDYILYSDDFTIKDYQVPETDLSDHRPVVSVFSK